MTIYNSNNFFNPITPYFNEKLPIIRTATIASICVVASAALFATWQNPSLFSTAVAAISLTTAYQIATGQWIKTTNPQELIKTDPPTQNLIKKRPEEVKQAIGNAFQSLSALKNSTWSHNGETSYKILGINERLLLQDLIQKMPEEKVFTVVDLGAGDFTFAKTIAKFIRENKSLLLPDQKVHIISVRGEANLEEDTIDEDCAIRTNLGQFEIENLQEAFTNKLSNLKNKVDLVVSSWTFRHLVDPVGTLTQTIDLLKPKTGHLLMDGFFALEKNDQTLDKDSANLNLQKVLTKLQVPVILSYEDSILAQFALKRPSSNPCSLSLAYADTLKRVERDSNSSALETVRFTSLEPDDLLPLSLLENELFNPENTLCGDQNLLNELDPIIRKSRKLPPKAAS